VRATAPEGRTHSLPTAGDCTRAAGEVKGKVETCAGVLRGGRSRRRVAWCVGGVAGQGEVVGGPVRRSAPWDRHGRECASRIAPEAPKYGAEMVNRYPAACTRTTRPSAARMSSTRSIRRERKRDTAAVSPLASPGCAVRLKAELAGRNAFAVGT